MIDLATTVGAETPIFLNEDHSFWVERPSASPFVERGTIGFTGGGHELPDGEETADLPDLATDTFLDEMVARSRRDVERYPESGRIRANLGIALLNRGDIEEAAAEFEVARELDPKQYIATANLARVRVLQGCLGQAQELYAHLRENHPLDPNPIMGLADIAERQGDLEGAIQRWQLVLELSPGSAVATANLGTVLLRLRRYREAIACFKQAIRLEARRATIHSALGVAYALAGEKARAIRAFRTAVSLNPRLPDAIQGLAGLLIDTSRAPEAANILERYVDQVAGDYEAHELLALAYAQLGNYQGARRQWFRALEALQRAGESALPHRARLINNLGVCFLLLGAFDEALQRFRDSISLAPDAPVPYQNLARLYLDAERSAKAVEVLRACAVRFPEDEETRLMLAYGLDLVGESSKAVAELWKWVGTSHATATAWTVLGHILADGMQRPEAAVRVLTEAHRRWPEDIRIANNLAYAYLMNGDLGSARTELASLPNRSQWQTRATETDIVLCATRGLLRLWEGDFAEAEQRYRQAAAAAEHQGMMRLAQVARQKMHLELARAHQRAGNIEQARREAQEGLRLPGDQHYRRDLRKLAQELRAQARQHRTA